MTDDACIHPWPHDAEPDEVLASFAAIQETLTEAVGARRAGLSFAEQWGWVHVLQERLAYLLVTLVADEDAHGPAVGEEATDVHGIH